MGKGPGSVVPGTIKDGGPRYSHSGKDAKGGQLPASSVRGDGTHSVKPHPGHMTVKTGTTGAGMSKYATEQDVEPEG